MSEEDIVVREATIADYEGVMALDEIYQGHDYLPTFYMDYIRDPSRFSVVAVTKSGKVVSAESSWHFDCV